MKTEDQSAVEAALADPAHHGGRPVDRIDTYTATVFLVGDDVYKLKKAVRFPFLDFGDVDARHRACADEVRLNRRTAPELYLGVVPVTREADGALALDGRGTPVDWVVHMRRFDQDTLFDRMAERGALTPALIADLAEAIADFHDRAETGCRDAPLAEVIAGNARDFAGEAAGIAPADELAALSEASRREVDRWAGLLESRRRNGRVRRCHGDLHLRNICLVDGRPTLFDCIEFNESFACIDVLYDLAFLLMDLLHRDLRGAANLVLNHWLDHGGDLDGLPVLRLMMAVRAAVRAKVAGFGLAGAEEPEALAAEGRAYVGLSRALLAPPRPRLIALGGLSGTGKTTLARGLAALVPEGAPGAVVLRSDVMRKRLAGVGLTERLPAEYYTPETSARVYDALADRARALLAAGLPVIVDAVHARPEERAAVAAVAEGAGVPFDGLWLDLPLAERQARLGRRVGDASDADGGVTAAQEAYDLGPITWTRLDAAPIPLARAAARLGLAEPDAFAADLCHAGPQG